MFCVLMFHHGYKGKEAILKFFLYSALNEFLFFFGLGIVFLSYNTFNIEAIMVDEEIVPHLEVLLG
jgi:hypothetical protein